MFDSHGDSVEVFDFDELANHLLEQGAASSPAELHGCLCGLLCSGAPASAEFGLDALQQTLDLSAHGELAGQVMQLYGASAAALADEEFSFHLLLPGDDTELAARTAALAGWCRAFLAGMAYGNAALEEGAAAWSSEGREILEDIAAMVDAGVDDDDDEDEAEGSFMEIVEYLRFATLNLFMERSEGAAPAGPDAPGATLH